MLETLVEPPLLLLAPVVGPPDTVPSDADDADEAGVDGLASALADGLPVFDGDVLVLVLVLVDLAGVTAGLGLWQSVVAALLFLALLFLAALDLDAAGAVELALLLALVLAVADAVPVAVVLEVGVTVLDGLSAGVDELPGLVGVPCGVTAGVTVPVDKVADGDVADGQTVSLAVAEAAGLLPAPAAPADEPSTLPAEPATVGTVLLRWEVRPTELPSETKASRIGGKASATPIANTAQAAATAGRSIRSRQSSCGRAWPCRACAGALARPASRRRTQPASPVTGGVSEELSLVKAVPVRTRARIRSRPSGRGSTWSAAACSACRRNSPKSGPCDPSGPWPCLLISPAPVPHAGPICHGPCDSSRLRG